ncbi:MAG: LexA family transcriptional regulator [Acidimicrobiales bacterium]
MSPRTDRRDAILEFLAAQGGTIESDTGRGLTAQIADAAGYDDLSTLNAMLARLEQEGVIDRDVRGKRTYAITLSAKGTSPRRTRPPAKSAKSARTRRPASATRSGPSTPRSDTDQLADSHTSLVGTVEELRRSQDDLASRLAMLERTLAERSAPTRRRWRRG